jgi:hypothetical protein
MQLEIGGTERIEYPSAAQIDWHVRHLPIWTPFAILSGDAEVYIQATPAGDRYRVELRQGELHRYAIVSTDCAVELFLAFHRWDEPAIDRQEWRRLTRFNHLRTPSRILVLLVLAVLVAVTASMLIRR